MSEGTATTMDDVRRAVESVAHDLSEDLQQHGVRLDADSAENVYGVWVIPAQFNGSYSMKKAWELDDFVRAVTRKLEDLLGARVSVAVEA